MSELVTPVAAAIFDLDGTLTHTDGLHVAAWKQVFDAFFVRRRRIDEWQRPFDTPDYRAFVDGRPRRDGILALLASRGMSLPNGSGDDAPGLDTIEGLARQQRQVFLEQLDRVGASPDVDALRLLTSLREIGAKLALASADEDAGRILDRAGLGTDLFDAALFAQRAPREDLPPKPAPDTVRACLEMLDVATPERVVMFDDSIAGTAAARDAGIGLVVGIDRGGNATALRANGADWVVQGFEEISVLEIVDHLSRRTSRR